MLSFIYRLEKLISKYKSINNKIHKVTLQIQAGIDRFLSKRVYKRASLTVEAAFALCFFIFAIVLIMLPFKMMDAHRKMQAMAESINKKLCQYGYLSKYLEEDEELKKKEDTGDDKEELFDISQIAGNLAFSQFVLGLVQTEAAKLIDDEHIQDISTMGSEFLAQDDMLIIKINYKYELPFAMSLLSGIEQEVVSSRRLWIGREGRSADDKASEEEEDDEEVYVGKSSTRYHLSADCHYLSNNLKTATRADIKNIRNEAGAKYHACARCAKQASSSVYVLPSGRHYHSSRDCTAINAYVKTVKKSSVEHLGACSYCGK